MIRTANTRHRRATDRHAELLPAQRKVFLSNSDKEESKNNEDMRTRHVTG